MRFVVAAWSLISLGALPLAVADPATSSQPAVSAAQDTAATPAQPAAAQPAPAANASTPASPPPATNSAAASDKPQIDPREQRLISMGYHAQMRHGEKLFCKREVDLGSRLASTAEHCGTVEELAAQTRTSRDVTEKVQRTEFNPQGH